MTELRGIDRDSSNRLPRDLFIEAHDERLRRVVGHVARRLHVAGDDRDDLFQETVTRLCSSWDSIAETGTEAVFEYAERIAERIVIDTRRSRDIRNEAWLGRVHDHHAARPADPAEVAVRSARVRHVRRALRRLPRAQRHAVVLAEYEEVSIADGARLMQITPTAYKSLLQRARARLRIDLLDAPTVTAILSRVRPRRLRWRPKVSPMRAFTGFIGVAAWCVVLIHPPMTTLPHVEPVTAPAYAYQRPVTHRAPEPLPPSAHNSATRPTPTSAAEPPTSHPRSLKPKAQVCVADACVGDGKIGDNLCLANGQGDALVCAKQDRVALCESVPDGGYATCSRHGDPDWLVPPPPP